MHFELTPVEALWKVLPKSERFDPLDYPAAVALLLEVDHTHASDELMHLRCDLRFQAVIPFFSHSCPLRAFYTGRLFSPSALRAAFRTVRSRLSRSANTARLQARAWPAPCATKIAVRSPRARAAKADE